MFNAMGMQAAQLANDQRGFVSDYRDGSNAYYVTPANTWMNLALLTGECYTPSGVAMIGLHVHNYPSTTQLGYFYIKIDGVYYVSGIHYAAGTGWQYSNEQIHVIPGLAKDRKHVFTVDALVGTGSMYCYVQVQYLAQFWAMDFPARMFSGPPSESVY